MVIKNKYYPYFLAGAILCLYAIAALLNPYFPFLLFFAFAPLFALVKYSVGREKISALVSVSMVILALVLINNILVNTNGTIYGVVFYSLVVFAAITLYRLIEDHSPNKMGLLTLVVFWLSVEYLLIKMNVQGAEFVLGNTFSAKTTLLNWSKYTGLLGVSAYVLLANVFFFQAFFDDLGIFNPRPDIKWLIWGFLVTTLPVVVSGFVQGGYINYELTRATYGPQVAEIDGWAGFYLQHGEYIGRTAIWIGILAILFPVVRYKTEKNK